jgi:hypothetical protein
MTDNRDFSRIVERARLHYSALKDDISNTANRIEFIRLSALATEAHHLLTDLIQFEVGLVYSHVNGLNGIQGDPSEGQTFYEPSTDTPLDLPGFKSPYNPDL